MPLFNKLVYNNIYPGINYEVFTSRTSLKYNFQKAELLLEKYWDINPEKQNKKITDNEAIEQFNHLFTTSVKRRLRSDVAIGTSLSGGLDSSSVVAAAPAEVS